jgi:hypothetical protein
MVLYNDLRLYTAIKQGSSIKGVAGSEPGISVYRKKQERVEIMVICVFRVLKPHGKSCLLIAIMVV